MTPNADSVSPNGDSMALDDEWLAELEPYAQRFRMCLAEAGYPHAEVEIGPSGVFAAGAPWDVIVRAGDVADGRYGLPQNDGTGIQIDSSEAKDG